MTIRILFLCATLLGVAPSLFAADEQKKSATPDKSQPGTQQPQTIIHSASNLEAMDQELSQKVDKTGIAFAYLRNAPSSRTGLIHRAATGEAELHEEWADIMFVRAGSGTLVLGGKLVNPRPGGVRPGDFAGTSIDGGERKPIAAGDLIHIPAKLAHHVVLEPGKSISYLIIKVPD